MQERVKRHYQSIKLPQSLVDEDRGFSKCCKNRLVLAHGDSDTFKNDVTSAWIKASDPSDTFSFDLVELDSQVATVYTPTSTEFPNEPNAYYSTINWIDVLNSDGAGCYELKITYNIGGFTGSITWGRYELRQYSIQNALGTARLKCLFNLNHQIEGINFTGANVEDHIRFEGQIRDDQPNTEIDAVILNNRRFETVVNENLPTYEMKTDPHTDTTLKLFTDLYLLSSNELFISDYNAHTSSYQIKDVPARIQESPKRNRPDEFSRFETLSCILSKRTANDRTHY